MSSRKTLSARELMDAALRGELDEACARQLAAFGPDVVAMALLAASQQIAEKNRHLAERNRQIAEQEARIGELLSRPAGDERSSSTPSGMIPPYQNPPKQEFIHRGYVCWLDYHCAHAQRVHRNRNSLISNESAAWPTCVFFGDRFL